MNVLVATDMEGIAGIEDYRDCLPSHPSAYRRGCELMTAEVLAAVSALRAGGVERIAVGDWHMVGTNILRERMPEGVEVSPIADLALSDEDPSMGEAMAKAGGGSLDAAVFIGHHAATPNPRAFCSHTFVWDLEVILGGDSLSEVQVYAQALAAERIPALLVSGDSHMLDDLGDGELGSARLVPAMEGQGRDRSVSRPPAEVHAEIAAGIESALAGDLTPPPARSYPAELVITLEGEELARTTVAAPGDLLTAVADVFRTGRVSKDYRQLAKILPARAGSRLRGARRAVGGALATPVMRGKERRWLARSP